MSYGFLLDGKNFAYTSMNGLINGTITNPTSHSTPFTVNINVTASNAGGSCAKTLPVTIYNFPSISYTFKDSKTGQSYSDYVTVSGKIIIHVDEAKRDITRWPEHEFFRKQPVP